MQTAHVAYKLGSVLGKDADADNTYFTCVGVRNLEALLAVEKILFEFDNIKEISTYSFMGIMGNWKHTGKVKFQNLIS